MKNKFKIRDLENRKRSIDKEIARLRGEKDEPQYQCIGHSVETNLRTITMENFETTDEVHLNYSYYRKGNDVKCIIENHTKEGLFTGEGIAKCHIDDEFNLTKGLRLAYLRAYAELNNKRAEEYKKSL